MLEFQLTIDASQEEIEHAATVFSSWQDLDHEGDCKPRAFVNCPDEIVANWECVVRTYVRTVMHDDTILEDLDIRERLYGMQVDKDVRT